MKPDYPLVVQGEYASGQPALAPRFTQIERREANGTVVFPDLGSTVDFVSATTTRSQLADQVPVPTEPFARFMHRVLVAAKA